MVSSVGFPIAACVYLAVSNEKLRQTITENTKAIESLKQLIIVHNMEYTHMKNQEVN